MIKQMTAELVDGCLHVVAIPYEGKFNMTTYKLGFEEILFQIAQNNIEKVLLDLSPVNSAISTIEGFQIGEFMAKQTSKLKSKKLYPAFAIIINEKLSESEHFFESVAVNRGMNLKLFTQVCCAANWLNVKLEHFSVITDQRAPIVCNCAI